jgi:hypothetical protein
MSKVVTEKPRRGSHNTGLKTGRRLSKDEYDADDHGALRHPVSAHSQHRSNAKEFSDLLGPLRRYLRKQVGRPWNAVYSEMSQILNHRTLSGQHIWRHVFHEVELHPRSVDGKFYHPPRKYVGETIRVTGLYVHPTTGLLCWAPKRSRESLAALYPTRHTPPVTIKIDDTQTLVIREGIWYRETYAKVRVRIAPFDIIDPMSPKTYPRPRIPAYHYGEELQRVAVKQLNHKELRHYKLTNGGQ